MASMSAGRRGNLLLRQKGDFSWDQRLVTPGFKRGSLQESNMCHSGSEGNLLSGTRRVHSVPEGDHSSR